MILPARLGNFGNRSQEKNHDSPKPKKCTNKTLLKRLEDVRLLGRTFDKARRKSSWERTCTGMMIWWIRSPANSPAAALGPVTASTRTPGSVTWKKKGETLFVSWRERRLWVVQHAWWGKRGTNTKKQWCLHSRNFNPHIHRIVG